VTRHVAVGPTREAAARVFGTEHDDLFLSSYADLAQEVNLREVGSLDLAAGEGLYAALDAACRQLRLHPGLSLRLEHSPGDSAALVATLTQHAVTITDLQEHDGTLILVIGVSNDPAPDPLPDLLVKALDLASAALAASSPNGHVSLADPSEKSGHTETADATPAGSRTRAQAPRARRQRRPQPRLLRALATVNKFRTGRRRRATLLVALAAVVVLLLFAILLGGTSERVVATLVSLQFLVVVGAIGVLVVAVLLLARQVHAQTGRLERMVLRSRDIEQQHSRQLGQQVHAVADGQARFPFMTDYLEAMAAAASSSSTRLVDDLKSLESGVSESHLATQRQVQAMLNLNQIIEIRHRLPPMGGWAASADFNLLVVQELINLRPRKVLECGSGTSTLLLALAVRQYDLPTKVIALEHLEQFRASTQRSLEQHGVADFAEVRLAPLVPVPVPDHATPWYSEQQWDDLDDIGLLVVDGPPSTTGKRPRYPAAPLLVPRMSSRAVIVVDDLIRPEDREVVQSWRGLLPDFDYEHLNTFQKHAGVFRRGRG
jgi:cell division protein FtsB